MEDYKCVPDCGPNEIFTPGGGCDCKPGFVKYNGEDCVKECPKKSWWDAYNKKCQCEWGYELVDWQCVKKQPKW